MLPSTPLLDVLIIGAGQAGLAMGRELQRAGLDILLIDAHARVGDSWRRRFDSLVLFTPRAYSALPGLALQGDPEGYPTKVEIADYLESYAAHFRLPVRTGTRTARLEQGDNLFQAIVEGGEMIRARAVVIATGAFQEPIVPPVAEGFANDVVQLTPERYRNPGDVPGGTVLVAGDGATGRQIALELAETHRVVLATGRPRRVSPDRVFGKSIFWWVDKTGLLRTSRHSRIGRRLMETEPFPGKHLALDRLREHGVTVVGRLASADGRAVTFATGETSEIDAVIWATGYRDRTDWVAIPGVADARGAFVHERGVSPVSGLYFIGRSWQWSRGSALVTGVGADARYIGKHLLSRLGERMPVDATTHHAEGALAP
jgi:putative flavoprotein involved in K+ transport